MDEPPRQRALFEPHRHAGIQALCAGASTANVISSRKLDVQPFCDNLHALRVFNGGIATEPTHWSFGQLCSLASPGNSPAGCFREARLPAPGIADCK